MGRWCSFHKYVVTGQRQQTNCAGKPSYKHREKILTLRTNWVMLHIGRILATVNNLRFCLTGICIT